MSFLDHKKAPCWFTPSNLASEQIMTSISGDMRILHRWFFPNSAIFIKFACETLCISDIEMPLCQIPVQGIRILSYTPDERHHI